MIQNKKDFKHLNVKIDYLTFNFPTQDIEEIKTIAKWFSTNFNCRTYLCDQKTKRLLTTVKKPQFDIKFFQVEPTNTNNPWRGVALRLTGNVASHFYSVYKSTNSSFKELEMFQINLGRIDLCYDRTLKPTDSSVTEFLKRTQAQNPKTSKLTKGQCLTVWKRKHSPRYYRTYLRENGNTLRFELELKRNKAKEYQHSFFRRDFEEFEQAQLKNFFQATYQIFRLEEPFLDWCQERIRFLQNPPINFQVAFSMGYLNSEPTALIDADIKRYKVLQLINFLKTQNCRIETLGYNSIVYQSYQFQINDFLTFIGESRTNYYRLKQWIQFFQQLRTLPSLEVYFSETHYRGISLIPYVEIYQVAKNKAWQITLSVCEEFQEVISNLPFHLSSQLLTYGSKNDLRAKIILLRAFAQPNPQKQLDITGQLKQLHLKDRQILAIKKCFMYLLLQLSQDNIIKSSCRLYGRDNFKEKQIKSLTSNSLTRAKLIEFEEIIHL